MSLKILAAVSVLIFGTSCSPSRLMPSEFKVEVPEFVKPKVKEWTYPNGLKVVHFYYPELPLVNVSMISKRGRLAEANFTDGVKTATISLLKDGGAGIYGPEKLDEKLDSLATNISIGQDNNFTNLEMSCLSENLEESFSIFSDVVFKPKFNSQRFELWKTLVADGIRRRKESKETLSSLSFSNVIYSGQSPWYSPLTSESLSAIKVEDLKDYHKALFNPSDTVLVFVGAIDEKQTHELVEKKFYNWESPRVSPGEIKAPQSLDPAIYVLESEFQQAEVELGYLGDKSKKADPYEQALFNIAFGQGSFSSLLFQEIRDNLGLAYSVSGAYESDKNLELFNINIGTKSEKAIQTVQEILNLLDRIRKDGIPSDTLEQARLSALQTYIFKFSNPQSLAKRDTLIELYGLPSDWDISYKERISSITEDEILNFINTNIKPEDLRIVIVGKVSAKDVKKQFPNRKVCELEFSELPKVKECR